MPITGHGIVTQRYSSRECVAIKVVRPAHEYRSTAAARNQGINESHYVRKNPHSKVSHGTDNGTIFCV